MNASEEPVTGAGISQVRVISGIAAVKAVSMVDERILGLMQNSFVYKPVLPHRSAILLLASSQILSLRSSTITSSDPSWNHVNSLETMDNRYWFTNFGSRPSGS